MGAEWFRLSNGNLKQIPVKGSSAFKPVHWVEEDVEHLLALNPHILDVADQLPIRFDGGSTSNVPDQAYIDELGRLTIVELKKVTAALHVIAQAIAYADHWRLLPPGEIDLKLKELCAAGGIERRLSEAMNHVCGWIGNGGPKQGASTRWELLDGLRKGSKNASLPFLTRLAQQHGDCDRLPFLGASGRIIIVAPDFTDDCIKFAEQLSERMVSIELVKLEIVRANGEVFVGRQWVRRNDNCEPTWRCLRRLWRSEFIRENFVLNGWADHLNLEAFSLSLKGVPAARLWFSSSKREGEVYTVVPDRWHAEDRHLRTDLRERFLGALPKVDRSTRWIVWGFDLPDEQAKMDRCVREVAEAVVTVLGAERPE